MKNKLLGTAVIQMARLMAFSVIVLALACTPGYKRSAKTKSEILKPRLLELKDWAAKEHARSIESLQRSREVALQKDHLPDYVLSLENGYPLLNSFIGRNSENQPFIEVVWGSGRGSCGLPICLATNTCSIEQKDAYTIFTDEHVYVWESSY